MFGSCPKTRGLKAEALASRWVEKWTIQGLHTCPPRSHVGARIVALESGGLLDLSFTLNAMLTSAMRTTSGGRHLAFLLRDDNPYDGGDDVLSGEACSVHSNGPLEVKETLLLIFRILHPFFLIRKRWGEGRAYAFENPSFSTLLYLWSLRLLFPLFFLRFLLPPPAMSQKGKSVAVTGVSGTTPTAARGPKYRSYEGLCEWFWIGTEYDIIMAKEEESYLVNKPGCFTLSLDLLEAGFRLPLPQVARALLNTWGIAPIQLTPNSWRTICIFCIICRLRGVLSSAKVFREQFSLASSSLFGKSVYYTKHRSNRMRINFGKKHSNNKGWMHRIFFDEARASDSLNLASVRNAEDFLTKFQLVQHGLSRPWDAEELAVGRDQDAMENYAEQIVVTSCLVYVNEGVRTLIAEEWHPTSPQAPEKRPPLICLKRKSGAKVVSKKAAQPVAEEEAEEAEEEEETVAAGEVIIVQGSTSGGAKEAVHAVEVPKGATVPIPPVEVAVEIPTQTTTAGSHEAKQMAETEEGGPRGSPVVAGDQESTTATGATDAVREETNAADKGRAGSEEDHLPLTQFLKAKDPLQPSTSFLEAALERIQEGPSRGLPPCPIASHVEVLARCQGQGPGDAPECSEEVYQEQRVDEDESVDVEALVDGVTHSLGVLKRLALRAQNHQQMWDAEFAFCKELQTEAELKEEVKDLQDTLHTSELNLAIARAEKEALTNILSEAKARGVTEYKAGPIFKEDLEQYGALCYKVGLGAEEDQGRRLALIEYALEAFEAALCECR
ncbi:hypothetical protein Taro_010561 [Colocasia esculenta]|uniref:Transposase (putative) gypsy type domain-containing protein n=1 Tax=Colocasia esculenta TaxID=4460 RepID=A0A843U805_COLES|nr:hypothetical protein [Colocasia esculenta]